MNIIQAILKDPSVSDSFKAGNGQRKPIAAPEPTTALQDAFYAVASRFTALGQSVAAKDRHFDSLDADHIDHIIELHVASLTILDDLTHELASIADLTRTTAESRARRFMVTTLVKDLEDELREKAAKLRAEQPQRDPFDEHRHTARQYGVGARR